MVFDQLFLQHYCWLAVWWTMCV